MSGGGAPDDMLDAIARVVDAGSPVSALRKLAPLLESNPANADYYREGVRALFSAIEQPEQLAAWEDAEKRPFYRSLMLQADCAERPLILASAAAARLTSANASQVQVLVAELAPTLRTLIEAGDLTHNLVIFLLVVRESLGTLIPQERLSALHREWFARFTAQDLTLLYCVLFYPQNFGRNRDDVLGWLAQEQATFLETLQPEHVLLIEWLIGQPVAQDALVAKIAGRSGEESQPAARALILRHGLAAAPAGAGQDVLDQAEKLARARAVFAARAPSAARRRLESKGWMAFHAARTVAAKRLPLFAFGERRVRVAVCVSGQLRGFRKVLPTWLQSLFAQVDCTFFVHSWAAIGRAGAQPSRIVLPFEGEAFTAAYKKLGLQEGFEAIQQRYPSLFAALRAGGTVTAEEVGALYRTPHVVIDDDTQPPFAEFSNQQKMHYKIWAAHRMMEESGEEFDIVVRVRPDLEIRNQAFHWRDMAAVCAGSALLFTERPYGVHYGKLMIGDQFAIGTPTAMARYAAAWTLVPELASLRLAGCPAEFVGHVSLAQACWLNGLDVRRAPVRFGPLREPERLSVSEIVAALEGDAAGRMDGIDRELIGAASVDQSRA